MRERDCIYHVCVACTATRGENLRVHMYCSKSTPVRHEQYLWCRIEHVRMMAKGTIPSKIARRSQKTIVFHTRLLRRYYVPNVCYENLTATTPSVKYFQISTRTLLRAVIQPCSGCSHGTDSHSSLNILTHQKSSEKNKPPNMNKSPHQRDRSAHKLNIHFFLPFLSCSTATVKYSPMYFVLYIFRHSS